MNKQLLCLLLSLMLPYASYAQAVDPPKKRYEVILIPHGPKIIYPYKPIISLEHGAKVKGIADNWLALIASLHEEKDLIPRNIEKKLKIKLKKGSYNESSYHYWHKLGDMWVYDVSTHPYPNLKDAPRIVLALRTPGIEYPPEIGEFCIDMGLFDSALAKLGYRQSRSMNLGGPSVFYVSRDGRVQMQTNFIDETIKNTSHECLESIDLNVVNDQTILEEFKE